MKVRVAACLVGFAFLFLTSGLGQTPATPQKEGRATFVEEAPVLDGDLGDIAWTQAAPLSDFHQKDPEEGAPGSEATTVYVVYTREAIFFGFFCQDREPDAIIASERRRDADLVKDDSVAILLDTFYDRRNAFLFRTNSLGAQYDALVTDEGVDINVTWDEKWAVAAARSAEGWTAEVMIPFKSLRMNQSESKVFGLEIERLIRRKNEAVYWNTFDRNFQFEDVSRAGRLTGLENVEQGLRWRIKPFGLAGFEQFPDGRDGTITHNLSDVGLELVKFRPSPSLTLDMTANTDFAQTEVDDLVTNVTRFPLFFPERREFFLEGAGTFEFGTGMGFQGSRDFKLFFSRRIGLSPDGDPIPIIGGAKFTGRTGAYTLGAINMQTRDHLGFEGNNYGVFRLKRDLFERSYLGVLFTNRQSPLERDYNRVIGVDSNFVFVDNLNVQAFLAKTFTPGVPDDDWSAFGRILWDTDLFVAGAEYLLVQRNFNPELGFVPRSDQRKTTLQLKFGPRPKSDVVRQYIFRTRMDYTQNQDGDQESMQYHMFTFETLFESGDRFFIDFHRNYERLFEPFDIRPDIIIPVGTYWHYDMLVMVDGAPHRKIAGEQFVRFSYQWGFFGGNLMELRVAPQIKLTDSYSVDLIYALDDVDLPQGAFTSHVLNTRVNYAFSNKWLTSATVQYSNLDDFVNFRFRLNYIFRPGDDLFFIYNEGRNLDDLRQGLVGRSFLVKWTYSFDF